MNQTAAAGPIAVPQGQFSPNEQFLFTRMQQMEGNLQQLQDIASKLAQNDYRLMSPGRMALVVGGAVLGAAAIGFATAAIYDRVKYGGMQLVTHDELNALQSAASTQDR